VATFLALASYLCTISPTVSVFLTVLSYHHSNPPNLPSYHYFVLTLGNLANNTIGTWHSYRFWRLLPSWESLLSRSTSTPHGKTDYQLAFRSSRDRRVCIEYIPCVDLLSDINTDTGLPFLGNVHELPEKNSWMKFHEWAEEFGPIYQVNLAGTNHVWISRDKVAHELLSKRSGNYSDRPFIPALEHDNRDSGQYLPLMSKNEKWTRQRKFAKQIMDTSAKEDYYGYPELESVRLLFEVMTEPSRYNHALESFVARVTCRLGWGTATAAEELKQRARELLIGVSPTGSFANKLPLIMSLPESWTKSKAWELRRGRTERKFFETLQDDVREQIKHSEKNPEAPAPILPSLQPKSSWMRTFLENKKAWKFDSDLEGAYAVGMHGIAGALTVAAPMQSFCLALCHYPQYQTILHEEIDRVLGDRMIRFSDMPDMPVLRAFIRETLRWRPPVPTGKYPASRSGFEVCTACVTAERAVRTLSLDREPATTLTSHYTNDYPRYSTRVCQGRHIRRIPHPSRFCDAPPGVVDLPRS